LSRHACGAARGHRACKPRCRRRGSQSRSVVSLAGDRGFESISLQQGVRCEPDFLDQGCARAPANRWRRCGSTGCAIDFSKSKSQRDRFLAHAPDLVIVDEAHASARPRGTASGAEHQRYELLRELARDPNRQILLVTATPHSGIEESFRSLLGLYDELGPLGRVRRDPRRHREARNARSSRRRARRAICGTWGLPPSKRI
jgi:hypothetical protein